MKGELNHFKLKASFSRQYDAFLADRRYFNGFMPLLGKDFTKLGGRWVQNFVQFHTTLFAAVSNDMYVLHSYPTFGDL